MGSHSMDQLIVYKMDSKRSHQPHIALRFVEQPHRHRLDLRIFSNDDFVSAMKIFRQ